MIEDIIALGKFYTDSFYQNPKNARYAFVIEFKMNNEILKYDRVSIEEISEDNLYKYMYRKGPSNQYDFTPSSILQTKNIIKTINRITKWARDNKQIIPGLYESLEKSKNKIEEDIKNKIGREKNINYLLTIKINEKYVCDILPRDFMKNRVMERCEKYTGYSSEGYGKCAICGKKGKVYGLTLQTAGLVFYNVDKSGFAPQFNREYSWKQIPLCEDCSLSLIRGKDFLDKYLKINSGLGFYFYIIPSFLLKEDDIVKKFIEKIKKKEEPKSNFLENMRGLITKEDGIYNIVEKESDSLRLDLLFSREEKSRFIIVSYIKNLKPSWLRKLYNIQREIMNERIFSEEIMKRIFSSHKKGNFFKRFKGADSSGYIKTKKSGYIPWWILFLRNIFSSRNEFIEILSQILQRRKISYKFLLHKFGLFLQDSFKKRRNLSLDTLTTLSLYLFLNKLNLLEGDNMSEVDKKNFGIFGYEIFSNNERKYAFLIGALANYVTNIQAMERSCDPWEAPFRQKFNNLIIDQNKLRKIFNDCVEKLAQYRKPIPFWFPENLRRVLNTPEKWKSSIDEISYFFVLGLVLGNSLFKDKVYNNKGGDENGRS